MNTDAKAPGLVSLSPSEQILQFVGLTGNTNMLEEITPEDFLIENQPRNTGPRAEDVEFFL